MGFLGSIAGDLRKVIAMYANQINCSVLLPCAGNFTIGAALRAGHYNGKIIGCDVTLYTSALGHYLANEKMEVTIKEDCPEYLRPFINLSSPAYLAASVALMLDLRQVWKNKYFWHERVLKNTKEQFPELLEKTLVKLEKYHTEFDKGDGFSYYAMDAAEFLDVMDKESAVFIAPPTFGSRDYINQEKMLAVSLSWNAPKFQEISFKDVAIYEKIMRFKNWMIIMERPLPEIEKLLGAPVAVVHKGRNSITYAYGNINKKVVTRAYLNSVSPGRIFPGSQKITGKEKVSIRIIEKKQSIRMNELFMSSRVDYFLADVALSLALCLDGMIIGKLDYNLTTHLWALPEQGLQIYQRSDLAVPSVENRLAKLVLLLSQTKEVKSLIDEKLKDDFRFIVTTAFSKHPVSMKYRGIYDLHKRIEDKENAGFRLNYYAKMGLYILDEAFELWWKKYHN